MSPVRQTLWLTALAAAAFLGLRNLPDTHCALLHADHQPIVVDGVEFCGVNEEANFYRPRELRFPYALKVEVGPGSARGPAGRLTLVDAEGRALLDHQLALSHTRKLHLHLRSLARPGYVHLHPEPAPEGDWTFAVPADFDLTQGAHAYVDFVPVRSGRVALADAALPPANLVPSAGPADALQVAAFTTSASRAGESALWRIRMRRTDGTPLKLRPLMGSLGHAALFAAEPTAAAMGYAHLHPSLEGGEHDPEPTLSFRVRLPRAGNYDLWLHVDDGGDRYLRIPVVVTP
ncbi:hypothetical protein EBR16_05255 [bacterium]|jgi:hypothetical protein|nr:hypothetical protein [bacterium]